MKSIRIYRYFILITAVILIMNGYITANAGNLEARNINGVRYISGGIGRGERAELLAIEKQYNLKIILINKIGKYFARAEIKITNRENNHFIMLVSNGPWVLIDLNPGRYAVEANVEGSKKTKNVLVRSDNLKTLLFQWKK